ncbi:hypothetical protein SK224_07650 [Microbacterium sp. BG28]|uniref:hypothetical protein n=1 Tax=Microbacterium sp. BG28 TaxID=3097356 RepID=UPI002A5A7ABD|nr:hypothetical protein [Microbacterium sp. BG28]MDY0828999.1 hypothetical protein [Microbacterium sp. BG28]
MSALTLVLLLAVTGCAMNENIATRDLSAATETTTYAATVEVQHPGVPWANKVVIRLYVRDASITGVAAAVREAARAAADNPQLDDTDLTFIAYDGPPEDNEFAAGLFVMGSVSEIVGGKGVEDILDLRAKDVRLLAAE